MVTAATIHMALLGSAGLERVAAACHSNTRALTEKLCSIPGVERLFNRPVFHEQVLRLPASAKELLPQLAARNLLGGLDLSPDYPELGDALLVCATEKRTEEEMDNYVEVLAHLVR
jgi:glycine dehydrogenase subunit 1